MIEDITDKLLSDKEVAELENAMNTKNFKKAYKLAIKYHKEGVIAASYTLSILYRYGFHVKQDAKKELKYLTIGYEKKHVTSLFAMGLTYLYGRITEKNTAKGMEIIHGLADDGYQLAINFLIQNSVSSGQMSMAKLDEAGIEPIAEFDIPISEMDENTHNTLSKMMANSTSGTIAFPVTDKNTEQALVNKMLKDFFDNCEVNAEKSYRVASELHTMGRVEGHFTLGASYCFGIHVDVDVEKGLRLLAETSSQVYTPGMYILAIVFWNTSSMQKSKDISLNMMKELAQKGYKPAVDALKESPDGIPEIINLSYEYLCKY